jgi:CRISPR-associated endonuclease/helicase Cas3
MTASMPDTWRLFWAKTDRDGRLKRGPEWTHALWAHLLDVACAAEATFGRLPTEVRRRLGIVLGLEDDTATRSLLSILIGLHDVGKAIPAFQVQHPPTARRLAAAPHSLRFDLGAEPRHHGHASIPILHGWIEAAPFAERARPWLRTLTAFAGFHHGRVDPAGQWESSAGLGRGRWHDARHALIETIAGAWFDARDGWLDLAGAIEPRSAYDDPFPTEALAFAGWTTLADWLGSMAEHLPERVDPSTDLCDYLHESKAAAQKALRATRLHAGAALHAEATGADFCARFPDVFEGDEDRLRTLQRHAATIPLPPPERPALVLVEAPTGEGKTQAALHLAARLQARRADGGRGLYVALPTQATSNGLFPQLVRFLGPDGGNAHTGSEGPNVLLIHGTSALNPDLEALIEPADEDEEGRHGAYAARWFTRSGKRALLAPYGVGTVDQALLGALLSRHFFLRLGALAGKTVVFDEVHAYDGYVTALFEQLLAWLRALGVDVVLLSATLPKATRARLLDAWGMPEVPDTHAYPALIVAAAPSASTAGEIVAFKGGFETEQARRTEETGPTEIAFADSDPAAVAEQVRAAAAEGATVGVIVNLVDRAQAIFGRLQEMQDVGRLDADLVLLHARFPHTEREARERYVVGYRDEDGTEHPGRFGKRRREVFGDRPAVLVATQVAEQSLDLDVDLMLSDLAPVDLLLQRAGRLHRHDLKRPPGYARPRLVVLRPEPASPEADPDVRSVGGQKRRDDLDAVYLNLPLFRTYRVLRRWREERGGWSLPHDYRDLIEAVYGDAAGEQDLAAWAEAVKAVAKQAHRSAAEAERRVIPEPDRLGDLVTSSKYAARTRYDDADAEADRPLAPVTRLGRPSVEALCLYRVGGKLCLDAKGRDAAPLGRKLTPEEARALLRRSVRLSRRDVVRALVHDPPPEGWAETARLNPALGFHRPLAFDEHGRAPTGRTTVELHPDLGIVYHAASSD